jgi:methyl-accepting chemotaxis protein
MFRSIANIPIFRRLFYAFLLAAVIPGIIITILGFTFINSQGDRSQATQVATNALRFSGNIQSYLDRLNGQPVLSYQDFRWTATIPTQAKLQHVTSNVRNLEQQFESGLTQYQQDYQLNTSPQMKGIADILRFDNSNTTIPDDQQRTLTQVSNSLWPAYKAAQKVILNDLDQGKTPTNENLTRLNQRYLAVNVAWNHIENLDGATVVDVTKGGPSLSRPILLATVIAFLSTIMVVITIGYFVNLTITRPLKLLATLTKRIARGETDARAQIIGRDEIYMVATSMNNMLDNIVRLIQETQSQRDSLQAQVEKLVSEVSGVGEGDLRVQAEVTADALGVLADSFNYMVEELASLVVRVKMVATEVEKSASAILDHTTQLVESGDAQIQEISEAVIEVEEMASSSRQVAERSQVLYEVARNARQDAQVGREAVLQAVEGMGRINENVQTTAGKVQNLGERSREINEIVEAISSIAHQTNRLALDAAIQAAMAGENGKGFGAVAADIRRLAERAKDQTSKITHIVRSVREDIGSVAVSMQDTERETSGGARLTQEAGVALEAIFAAVEHQAREIENINQMATQQLQSSSAVVGIMHSVSDTTQQSRINTRDTSQNTERLARLVEQLRSSVEAFKLRENQDYLTANTGMSTSFSIEEEQDSLMTVSGVFRTVSSTAQSPHINNTPMTASAYNSLSLSNHADEAQPFYPVPNSSFNGGTGSLPANAWMQDEYNDINGHTADDNRAKW